MPPVLLMLLFCWVGATVATASSPEIISVRKIWDRAPHNAFTDLVRFQGKWFCTFREGERHAGGRHGQLRVLVSQDGVRWNSAALLIEEGVDLRDPKLSVMADGRLLLVSGGSLYDGDRYLTRAPRVALSGNGFDWSSPRRVLAEDHWVWRVTWHKGRGYGVSKLGETPTPRRAFLYWTTDGIEWNWITEFKLPGLTPEARKTAPSETTVRFLPDDRMVALIRPGWVGSSPPPYREWTFHKLGHRLGGPNFIRIPDGSLWAASRGYPPGTPVIGAWTQGEPFTVLARLTLTGYEPVLKLPSGGDTSYPGMVWYQGLLWISYYSSHEGKTSIYLARIRL